MDYLSNPSGKQAYWGKLILFKQHFPWVQILLKNIFQYMIYMYDSSKKIYDI